MRAAHLTGRLATDPLIKTVTTRSGPSQVLNFDLLCGHSSNDKVGIRCEAWNGTAETIAKHAKKGDLLEITGSIEKSKSAKGSTYYSVRVNGFEFLARSRKNQLAAPSN